MTLFKSTDGIVAGQPISPFFGAQNGVQGAGAVAIQSPATGSGPQQPVLEGVARGAVPANAQVNTVNGVSVGGVINAIGGDPCSVLELLASGNGNQANGGVGQGVTPNQQGENQQYTNTLSAVAMTENGPTPVNVDTLGVAPVPAGIATSSVGFVAGNFIG